MLSTKDYSKLTLDELRGEQKKNKAGKTATAFVIGMLVGIAVLAAVYNRFIFTGLFLVVAFLVGYSDTKKQKFLQTELSRRGDLG